MTGRTYQLMSNLGAKALSPSQKSTINAGLNRNIFDADPIEQNKSFQVGQGNSTMKGLNKAIGEKVYGVTGKPLIDQDWLAGGGKTLGKLFSAFGAPETGAAIANSSYLSGNPMQFAGQLASDIGAKKLGSAIMSAASEGTGAAGLVTKLFSFL